MGYNWNLPCINEDKVYFINIEVSNVKQVYGYLRCAVQYTNSRGELRIRVHTKAVNITEDPLEVYRRIDGAATAGFLALIGPEKDLNTSIQMSIKAAQHNLKLIQATFHLHDLMFPEELSSLLSIFDDIIMKRRNTTNSTHSEKTSYIIDLASSSLHNMFNTIYPEIHAFYCPNIEPLILFGNKIDP